MKMYKYCLKKTMILAAEKCDGNGPWFASVAVILQPKAVFPGKKDECLAEQSENMRFSTGRWEVRRDWDSHRL